MDIETKWIYPKANKDINAEILKLSSETGLSANLCTLFYNRNIRTKEAIQRFLNFGESDVPSPKLLKDLEKVADKVVWHLLNGKVTIYSDYDCDGWGCVIVFVKLMKKLGYEVNWYTNTRAMGYGLMVSGVDELMNIYPDTTLILTSDNGIVAFDGIEYAIDVYNVEVCVTDHHEPSSDGRLPQCSGVVDPKRLDETYPFDGLCGTGVIYKLCQVIYEKLGKNPKKCDEMLDIVAIATVADVVPLLEENRYYVKEGLKRINNYSKPIWAYAKSIFVDERFTPIVEAETIGFSYAPVINACSRLLGNMNLPIETFLMDDENPDIKDDIITNLKRMNDINIERKSLSDNQTDGVFGVIADDIDNPAYVIWHDTLTEGIVGIIAGRVCERFNRPVIVLTNAEGREDVYKGSGRSVKGFNMKEILDDIQARTGLLEAYGGHEGAAGVTIKKENLEAFKVEFILAVDDICGEASMPVKTITVDLALNDAAFDARLYDEMKSLEPYGQDFKTPVYGIRKFNPTEIGTFGGDEKKRHLKIVGNNVEYVAWNSGEVWLAEGEPKEDISCVGKLTKFDTYSNRCQITTREYTDIHFGND